MVESVDTSGLKLDPSLGTGSSPVVGTRVVTPSMGELILVMERILFFPSLRFDAEGLVFSLSERRVWSRLQGRRGFFLMSNRHEGLISSPMDRRMIVLMSFSLPADVVQWREPQTSNLMMEVRFLPSADRGLSLSTKVSGCLCIISERSRENNLPLQKP